MTQRTAENPFEETCYLLTQWGIWSYQDGLARMELRKGKGVTAEITDDQALLIDRALAAMQYHLPMEFDVIRDKYMKGKSLIEIAEDRRCSRQKIAQHHKLGVAVIDAKLNPLENGFIDGTLSTMG